MDGKAVFASRSTCPLIHPWFLLERTGGKKQTVTRVNRLREEMQKVIRCGDGKQRRNRGGVRVKAGLHN